MELRFLGQTYTASNRYIETEVLEQNGHFRGQSYSLRRPIKPTKSQLGLRKYRGITYSS